MFDKYPKPKRGQIIASKGEIRIRKFIQWAITFFGLWIMLPAILLTTKEFFFALFTWIFILLIIYFIVNPVLRFFKIYIIDKLFDTEERYRVQIVERLLYYYTHVAKIGWNEAKEYVDHLEKKHPTAVALEKWLDS